MTTGSDAVDVVADRYELHEVIGQGGAARVHRAYDRRLDRWIAVKVIPTRLEDPRRTAEVAILASVRHPSLVVMFDAVEDAHATYVVMELVEGGTLRQRLGDGALSGEVVAGIAADAAAALAHIHARGIVHRDITPANLLLPTEPGVTVKLADFGIAKLLADTPMGTTGLIGTAPYLSPEQVNGTGAGTPSDVYALGLVLLEALTGRPAFPGTTAESITARLLRDPEIPPSLDYGWRSLVTAMTSRTPSSRPTAAQVCARVAALRSGLVATAPMTLEIPPAARRARRRHDRSPALPPVAAIALTALAVAALAASAALLGSSPVDPVADSTAQTVPTPDASTATARPASSSAAAAAAAHADTAAVLQDVSTRSVRGASRTEPVPKADRPTSRPDAQPAAEKKPKPRTPPKPHGAAEPKPPKPHGATKPEPPKPHGATKPHPKPPRPHGAVGQPADEAGRTT